MEEVFRARVRAEEPSLQRCLEDVLYLWNRCACGEAGTKPANDLLERALTGLRRVRVSARVAAAASQAVAKDAILRSEQSEKWKQELSSATEEVSRRRERLAEEKYRKKCQEEYEGWAVALRPLSPRGELASKVEEQETAVQEKEEEAQQLVKERTLRANQTALLRHSLASLRGESVNSVVEVEMVPVEEGEVVDAMEVE